MGNQSTVIVLHDALHNIERDPAFGANLALACQRFRPGARHFGEARAGNFGSAATVVSSGHADETHLVITGGCTGRWLGTSWNGGRYHQAGDLHDTLKTILGTLGYRLSIKKDALEKLGVVDALTFLGAERRAMRDQRIRELEAENARLRAELATRESAR